MRVSLISDLSKAEMNIDLKHVEEADSLDAAR